MLMQCYKVSTALVICDWNSLNVYLQPEMVVRYGPSWHDYELETQQMTNLCPQGQSYCCQPFVLFHYWQSCFQEWTCQTLQAHDKCVSVPCEVKHLICSFFWNTWNKRVLSCILSQAKKLQTLCICCAICCCNKDYCIIDVMHEESVYGLLPDLRDGVVHSSEIMVSFYHTTCCNIQDESILFTILLNFTI
jgi:hypothetical protein